MEEDEKHLNTINRNRGNSLKEIIIKNKVKIE